jgi:hypothetical protein
LPFFPFFFLLVVPLFFLDAKQNDLQATCRTTRVLQKFSATEAVEAKKNPQQGRPFVLLVLGLGWAKKGCSTCSGLWDKVKRSQKGEPGRNLAMVQGCCILPLKQTQSAVLFLLDDEPLGVFLARKQTDRSQPNRPTLNTYDCVSLPFFVPESNGLKLEKRGSTMLHSR